jgi:hypothetical protein
MWDVLYCASTEVRAVRHPESAGWDTGRDEWNSGVTALSDRMTTTETNTDTELRESSMAETSPSRWETLAAIAFFGAAGLAVLAWLGFLIWVVYALLGF